jgi:acyl carrier protein
MTEIGPAIIEPTAENIRSWLIGRVAHYLEEPAETIDPRVPLDDYRLDSAYIFTLHGEIEETLGVIIEPFLMWDVENLADLADRVAGLLTGR